MVKYKKKNGYPFDVNDEVEEFESMGLIKESEKQFIRTVRIVKSNRILVTYKGGFQETLMQSKQYVHGLFDGFNLAKEQSL